MLLYARFSYRHHFNRKMIGFTAHRYTHTHTHTHTDAHSYTHKTFFNVDPSQTTERWWSMFQELVSLKGVQNYFLLLKRLVGWLLNIWFFTSEYYLFLLSVIYRILGQVMIIFEESYKWYLLWWWPSSNELNYSSPCLLIFWYSTLTVCWFYMIHLSPATGKILCAVRYFCASPVRDMHT